MDSDHPTFFLFGAALDSLEPPWDTTKTHTLSNSDPLAHVFRRSEKRSEVVSVLRSIQRVTGGWSPQVKITRTDAALKLYFENRALRVYERCGNVFDEEPAERETQERPTVDAAVAAIRQAIHVAGEYEDAQTALSELEQIWRKLEELSAKSESRYRLRLSGPGPKLSEAPEWLSGQIVELKVDSDEGIHSPHPLALDSAERLVRATLHALADHGGLRAELAAAPLGRVEVTWNTTRELRWVVGIAALPWPGVSTRVYERESEDSLRLTATSFHLADDIVNHARNLLTTGHDDREVP